jgi:diguanylate cyclase (GGDEF)-like protein
MFDVPTTVSSAFWTAAALASLLALEFATWTFSDQRILFGVVVVTVGCALGQLLLGPRMPAWGVQGCTLLSVALVSVCASIGPRDRQDIAVLYVWILIFAGMYFTKWQFAGVTGAVALAYGLVVVFGPPIENPIASGFTFVGTGVFAGGVTLILVTLLRMDAREDHLTRLANRRSWDERLQEEMDRARRSGTVLSVGLFDLDGFKAVNDRHGHAAGDALLREAARAWTGVTRSSGDHLARIGGDEFAILAPFTDQHGMRVLARRLTSASPAEVRFSFGTATWNGSESEGDLLRRADRAMYEAKQSRRTATALADD